MSTWDASPYLRYGDERTRPSYDLVARIQIPSPTQIFDLGCGPGNSTQVLKSRWTDANVCGVDNSAEMIERARESYPDQRWILADAASWSAEQPVDLVFSNAAPFWESRTR